MLGLSTHSNAPSPTRPQRFLYCCVWRSARGPLSERERAAKSTGRRVQNTHLNMECQCRAGHHLFRHDVRVRSRCYYSARPRAPTLPALPTCTPVASADVCQQLCVGYCLKGIPSPTICSLHSFSRCFSTLSLSLCLSESLNCSRAPNLLKSYIFNSVLHISAQCTYNSNLRIVK